METVLINKDKIKIMLNRHDMQKYQINPDFSCSSNEADLKIWSILDDISVTTSFDTRKGSFYVQMFPSKAGGCELFVSRIASPSKQVNQKSDGKRTANKLYIYKFENIDNILSLCKALSVTYKDMNSPLYYDEGSEIYYLTLGFESHYPSEFFGEKCKNANNHYVTEHCRLITDNAIDTLSRLAPQL